MIKPQSIFSEAFILEQKMKMDDGEFTAWFEHELGDHIAGYVETDFEQDTLFYEGKHYFVVSLTKDAKTGHFFIQVGAGGDGKAIFDFPELATVLQTGFAPSDSFIYRPR